MPNIKDNEIDIEKVSDLIKSLLTEVGENPEREGLVRTPYRVAKAYEFYQSFKGKISKKLQYNERQRKISKFSKKIKTNYQRRKNKN